MATVGAEWLEKDYAEKGTDALIRDFIAGKHDFQKSAVREVLGSTLYQECCRRRVDQAMRVVDTAVPSSPEYTAGRLDALAYLRGWMRSKRACGLNAAALAMIDDMETHCDAAILRINQGEQMECVSQVQ